MADYPSSGWMAPPAGKVDWLHRLLLADSTIALDGADTTWYP